jgi:hypothetical protein
MDITLENEETLGEVVHGVRAWLGDSSFAISSIEYDGTTVVPGENSGWEETELSSVETLNITVLSPGEQYAQDLHTIYQFVMLLHKALSAGNDKVLGELQKEAPYVINSLDEVLGKRASGYGKKLAELMEAAGVAAGELTPRVQDLLSFTKNLAIILEDRIREATAPLAELKNTATTLQELNPKLMDVSVLLQTGKDREAMNSVIEFTELAEKLIRIYRILERGALPDIAGIEVEGVRFDAFYKELNENLRELVEAFDAQDSVLIGDLLEYEVVPRTERLQRYIDTIEEEHADSAKES